MYIYTILSKRAGTCNTRTESKAKFGRAGRKQISVYSRDAAVLATARARACLSAMCVYVHTCVRVYACLVYA